MPTEPWRHRHEQVNGLRFHYVEAGAGSLVLLLHGFPEFWYSWRRQIPALAQAGSHVLAPDLRGYNESEKPTLVRDYRGNTLVSDIVALMDHAGAAKAVVVGHDWGGVIAWALAQRHPERVDRLVILNAPHPAALRRELLRSPAQWYRSSYILFFQLPWLAEWRLRAGNFAFLRKVLRREPVQAGAFNDEDVERYRSALAQPGALTAALNYYRAALRYPDLSKDSDRPIIMPTLVLWGMRDRYLGPGLAEDLSRWVPDLHLQRFEDASHWIQNDAPDRVNAAMLEFLQSGK